MTFWDAWLVYANCAAVLVSAWLGWHGILWLYETWRRDGDSDVLYRSPLGWRYTQANKPVTGEGPTLPTPPTVYECVVPQLHWRNNETRSPDGEEVWSRD